MSVDGFDKREDLVRLSELRYFYAFEELPLYLAVYFAQCPPALRAHFSSAHWDQK